MPTPPENAVVRLGELLAARMRRNSRLSLQEALAAGGGSFEPDAELVGHVIRNRRELSSWMRAALEESREGRRGQSPEASLRSLVTTWLQEKNQFLRVDGEAAQQLEALYRRAIAETACALSSPANDADAEEELRDAVCAAYSPLLQLAVLGLSPEELSEPVLDVGCGPNAALVRHLRERGVEALGIDRTAPGGTDGVLAADWLDIGYGEGVWGTVVSHLGFSLHFLRHHLAQRPAAESLALAHAEAYVRILRSLRIGGAFCYAPALPFVEALLPASSYRCEPIAPAGGLLTPALLTAREAAGLDLVRASRVLRTA